MGEIIVSLFRRRTLSDLRRYCSEKTVKVENSDHFPHLSKSDLERSKAGKDDPGGNINIFIKMKK